MDKIIFILCLSTTLSSIFAAAEVVKRPGKGVFEVSTELGMRVTPVALKNLEVQLSKIETSGELQLQSTAIVYYQDLVGVYRLQKGWFKLVKVQILGRQGGAVRIKCEDLQAGDEVVVSGAELLRVAEMDAMGDAE